VETINPDVSPTLDYTVITDAKIYEAQSSRSFKTEPHFKLTAIKNDAKVSKGSKHSAGLDLHACIDEDIVIPTSSWKIIPTGLTCKMETYLEAQVRSRSGLAAKFGVFVLNSPGTIDPDYEGEIKVILFNAGPEPFVVKHGDRIAQLVVAPFFTTSDLVDYVRETRGEGGFGSTGV